MPIEVTRKDIKNLYVRVNRRTGKVKVSCPIHISERGLDAFLNSKSSWIEKHYRNHLLAPKPEIDFDYQTGELHYLFGKAYPLKVVDNANQTGVHFLEDCIVLEMKGASDKEKRKKVLEDGYRTQLRKRISNLVRIYEPKMNVTVNEYRVKRMSTRWGSCNIRAKRIWLSLELAKKSEGCLEMVVVHEMVHLLERLHNKRFYKFMDLYMPSWRTFERELKSGID